MQPLRSSDLRRVAEKLNPSESRGTKECNYKFFVDDVFVGRVTISKGREQLKRKTFFSACAQFGMTPDQVAESARCKTGRREYEDLVRKRRALEGTPDKSRKLDKKK
jgi:hypothetical protein